MACFCFLAAAYCLVLCWVDRSTENKLARLGNRVTAEVTASYVKEVQHSDNIPSQYFRLSVRYVAGNTLHRKTFSVPYETYRDFKKGDSIQVVYDPAEPDSVLIASDLREGTGSRTDFYTGIGFFAAAWALLIHSRKVAESDRLHGAARGQEVGERRLERQVIITHA